MDHKLNRRTLAKTAGALAGGTALGRVVPTLAQHATPQASPATEGQNAYEQSPWWPWLTAHIENENPPDVPGGPITTTAGREDAAAFWVFPGLRKLDPTVFGTEDNPIGTE